MRSKSVAHHRQQIDHGKRQEGYSARTPTRTKRPKDGEKGSGKKVGAQVDRQEVREEGIAPPEMKFKDIRDQYYEITEKASEVTRQLTLAGFAVIWVFRTDASGIHVPVMMYPAAVAFALVLIADGVQYGWAAFVWHGHAVRADRECEDDNSECHVPETTNAVPWALFLGKLGTVVVGYVLFVVALMRA